MLIRLYDKNPSQRDIDRVLDILNGGGVIVFPTDTAYALGCHALKERPIERICKIKGMDPRKHRFSIVCYDLSDISQYVQIDNATFKTMKRNLPGPFTFVLRAGSRLPKIFSNRKEVGIRVPDNDITREICRQLGAPLLSTTVPYDESDDIGYLTDPELIDERLGILPVNTGRDTLALYIGADAAVLVRTLIRDQPCLFKGAVDDLHGSLDLTDLVRILDAENEITALVFGDEIGVKRSAQVADVHASCRTGGVSGSDFHKMTLTSCIQKLAKVLAKVFAKVFANDS